MTPEEKILHLRGELDGGVRLLERLLGELEQEGRQPMLELVDALERAGAQIPPAMKMFLAAQG